MILAMAMRTKMEPAILLKSAFKKVAQMKEVAHKATVYVAHVSFDYKLRRFFFKFYNMNWVSPNNA